MFVFGALLVLTVVTVGVSYLHLPTTPAVAVGAQHRDGEGGARRDVLHAPEGREADGVLAARPDGVPVRRAVRLRCCGPKAIICSDAVQRRFGIVTLTCAIDRSLIRRIVRRERLRGADGCPVCFGGDDPVDARER